MPTSANKVSGLSLLEQLGAAQECTTPRRPFLRGINREKGLAVLFQPRCKMWSCPYCAKVNQALWTVKAYHGAEVLSTNEHGLAFLTVTSSPKLGPTASVGVFSHAWDNLRRRASRSAPGGQYLLIPERHQDGRVHAHAIETYNLGTRWWKDNAASVGLGFMAEEDEARTPGGAAHYVAKYIGKSLGSQDWPQGWRRVRTSRAWPKLPEMPPAEGWEWMAIPKDEALVTAIQKLEHQGFFVKILDHVEAWRFVGSAEDCAE